MFFIVSKVVPFLDLGVIFHRSPALRRSISLTRNFLPQKEALGRPGSGVENPSSFVDTTSHVHCFALSRCCPLFSFLFIPADVLEWNCRKQKSRKEVAVEECLWFQGGCYGYGPGFKTLRRSLDGNTERKTGNGTAARDAWVSRLLRVSLRVAPKFPSWSNRCCFSFEARAVRIVLSPKPQATFFLCSNLSKDAREVIKVVTSTIYILVTRRSVVLFKIIELRARKCWSQYQNVTFSYTNLHQ